MPIADFLDGVGGEHADRVDSPHIQVGPSGLSAIGAAATRRGSVSASSSTLVVVWSVTGSRLLWCHRVAARRRTARLEPIAERALAHSGNSGAAAASGTTHPLPTGRPRLLGRCLRHRYTRGRVMPRDAEIRITRVGPTRPSGRQRKGADAARAALCRSHQAAHHRAAPGDHVPDHVPGPAGLPSLYAGRRRPWSGARWRPAARTPSTATWTATSTRSCTGPSNRPLVTGACHPRGALRIRRRAGRRVDPWLGLLVNGLSAGAARPGARSRFYVGFYTMLLKRRTSQNIVWGGAAGCMPVLIGWSAVTGSLAWPAWSSSRSSSSGRRRTTGRCPCASRRVRSRRGADAPGRRQGRGGGPAGRDLQLVTVVDLTAVGPDRLDGLDLPVVALLSGAAFLLRGAPAPTRAQAPQNLTGAVS